MPAYTRTGPFNDNAAPAISAGFFNNVETWISAMDDAAVSVSSGGVVNCSKVALALGSFSKVSKFTGTATTTSTFFNHGLGVLPDIVLIQLDGVSSSAHSITADYSTMTATQVKLTADGTNTFVGLAIKF